MKASPYLLAIASLFGYKKGKKKRNGCGEGDIQDLTREMGDGGPNLLDGGDAGLNL